jgi:hypothetical protein
VNQYRGLVEPILRPGGGGGGGGGGALRATAHGSRGEGGRGRSPAAEACRALVPLCDVGGTGEESVSCEHRAAATCEWGGGALGFHSVYIYIRVLG